MLPRKGDEISVLPYGKAIVERVLEDGRCLVTLDRMIKRENGTITNQAVVELHPVWVVRGTVQ